MFVFYIFSFCKCSRIHEKFFCLLFNFLINKTLWERIFGRGRTTRMIL